MMIGFDVKVMSVHSMTTAEEVTADVAKQIGLTEPTYYGIFQSGSDGGKFSYLHPSIKSNYAHIRLPFLPFDVTTLKTPLTLIN